jgi:competence protein ComEC
MALVALFEMLKRAPHDPALPTPGPLIGALQATTRGIGSVLLISFVAGLATDPFAIYHFQRFAVYALPANLIAAPIMSFLVAPMAAAAAILAPFGLADPALELMASALDLIAAVGQTFGERSEAIRAVPKPSDVAFVLCVVSLLWACLWRGALRWIAAPIFAASVALYITATLPVAAFDADLRAVYARDNGRWTLLAASGRLTYARDRLGSMLGLSPSEIERLAPPEACGEGFCQWQSGARAIVLVRDAEALERACIPGAIVIAPLEPPTDFASRCQLAALLGAHDIAQLGGATITETPLGPRIARATSPEIRRPWTPRVHSADQE